LERCICNPWGLHPWSTVNANDGALSKRAVRATMDSRLKVGTILSGDRGAMRSHI